MTKIKHIQVKDLGAIDFQDINLDGCSILVTGANRKGKTTLLRRMFDRILGLRPESILRNGATEGKSILELTNGERFEWEYNDKGLDKLVYITKEGLKNRVTGEIAARYIKKPFDIDKFMQAQPKPQLKMLADLVGLDFEAIDAEYKVAYDSRTLANQKEDAARIKLEEITIIPEYVERVDIEKLSKDKEEIQARMDIEYNKNKAKNDGLRTAYDILKDEKRKEVAEFNKQQEQFEAAIAAAKEHQGELKKLGYEGKEVELWIETLTKPKRLQDADIEISKLPVPEYIPEKADDKDMKAIDEKIISATRINEKAATYKKYVDTKGEYAKAKQAAAAANEKVLAIVERKKEMIRKANLPNGIEFGDEGVLVNGRLLQDTNISTSEKYIAAIKLGALQIGEVEALHFDASTLDRVSLMEVEQWAANYPGVEGGLQLLVERPEFEGGEIRYEIIQQR